MLKRASALVVFVAVLRVAVDHVLNAGARVGVRLAPVNLIIRKLVALLHL